MKSNKLSFAITAGIMFAALGTSAFAADRTYADGDTSWQFHNASNKTRVQVIVELNESRAPIRLVQDGSFDHAYPPIAGAGNVSSKTRAQVMNELNDSSAQMRLVQDGSFEYSYSSIAETSRDRARAEAATRNRAAGDAATRINVGG